MKKVNAIKKNLGLGKRHIVDDNTTTSDLCEMAASKLLEDMDIDKDRIGAIVLVTQTPDYFQPASASYLHGKLNLNEDCAAFDVNQGCTGYIYGLWLAYMMIETNTCENVLLLVGDTMSKIVNPLDPNIAPMYGDAGTATLVQKSEKEEKSFFTLHTDGKQFDTIIQPQGGFRNPTAKQINNKKVFNISEKRSLENLYMDGTEVFLYAIEVEPKAINEILEISNKTQENIDYIIFHQTNKYTISNMARSLKFPIEKAPFETVGKYGNQSSASIPCTICDAINKDVATKKVELVLSGFGVGLSWASCQLSLDKIYCPDVICYK